MTKKQNDKKLESRKMILAAMEAAHLFGAVMLASTVTPQERKVYKETGEKVQLPLRYGAAGDSRHAFTLDELRTLLYWFNVYENEQPRDDADEKLIEKIHYLISVEVSKGIEG